MTPTAETDRPPGLTWPAPQWLALFYDLAFAAGIIAIASSYGYDYSPLGALWLATAYGIIASAWILTGGATGAFTAQPRPVTSPVVVLVSIQMAAILMLSVASGDTIAASSVVFDVLLAVLLATCLGLGWLVRAGSGAMPGQSQMLIVLAMALLAFAWIPSEAASLAVWIVALVALAVAAGLVVVGGHIDVHRFAHRLGELTIIIIGEILVKMVLAATDQTLWSPELLSLGATLVLLVAIFWIYFTGPVDVTALARRRRLVWITAHWSLHVGLLGLAVGLSKFLVDAEYLNNSEALAALLTGPALLVVTSLAVLDKVVGLDRWRIVAAAAALVAVVATASLLTDITPLTVAYAVGLVLMLAAGWANRGALRATHETV